MISEGYKEDSVLDLLLGNIDVDLLVFYTLDDFMTMAQDQEP